MTSSFNSNLSDLAKNPKLVKEYIRILEQKIGHGFKVDGIIEIGSYAKDEAVPESDIDTRVYVSSPEYYLWQTSVGHLSKTTSDEAKIIFDEFVKEVGVKPVHVLDWFSFNLPLLKVISSELDLNIEFGLADSRYFDFQLNNLDKKPSTEHQFLLSSQIIYDPNGLLKEANKKIRGKIYERQARLYQESYLDQLPTKIYEHLKPHKEDGWKLEKSRQIQWIKWAVRTVRDAAGAKFYIATGQFIYKKDDIFDFYKKFLPGEWEFIKELYSFKVDHQKREETIASFLESPDPWFNKFKDLTKRIEGIVQEIDKLDPTNLF